MDNTVNIAQLLNEFPNDDEIALDKILTLVYDEMKIISSKYLRDEYRNHTLQTTELVHEAYLKMIGSENITWESRGHFFGIAARSIRQILVDYARKRNASKRGNAKTLLSLDKAEFIISESEEQIINLDEALSKLEKYDTRSYKIVELRYFSGLSIEETAQVLNISPATVKRDWNFAKAWLYREMK